jgi:hypothetical protein
VADANFLTGSSGLIAVDKVGNRVLFLDPVTYATELTLEGFAPKVHELLVAPATSARIRIWLPTVCAGACTSAGAR